MNLSEMLSVLLTSDIPEINFIFVAKYLWKTNCGLDVVTTSVALLRTRGGYFALGSLCVV